jgi:hypothetical protein
VGDYRTGTVFYCRNSLIGEILKLTEADCIAY